MGTMEKEVSALTNEELAEKLKSLGENIGPITPTTRSLYEKRLKRRLVLESAATCTISYSLTPPANHSEDPSPSQKQCDMDVKVVDDCANNTKGPFYGVRLSSSTSNTDCFVFTCKEDAYRLMKEHQGSRFKIFQSRPEAESFSRETNESMTKSFKNSPKSELSKVVPNEGSPFKAPKPQDLTSLRKLIENDELDNIKSLISSNPRYLIGSGDNPTILQEGYRYNALHICAVRNRAEAAKLILDAVENPEFVKMMYPDDTDDSRWNRIQFLSDMYLNTPDKGNCESPLHFACKFGHIDVVRVLTMHPKIDLKIKNKFGESPKEVVCSRASKPSADLKEKICRLLEPQFYVPLLRNDDNTCPAKIARLWSLTITPTGDHDESMDDILPIPSFLKSKGSLNHSFSSPKDIPMSVRAFAGPMSSPEAEKFRKKWMMSPGGLSRNEHYKFTQIKRSDISKGFERIGRDLAKEMKVPWCEYWHFLKSTVDLESEEGMRKLEDHLEQQRQFLKSELSERRHADTQLRHEQEMCDLFGRLNLAEKSPSEQNIRNNEGSRNPVSIMSTKSDGNEKEENERKIKITSLSKGRSNFDEEVDKTLLDDLDAAVEKEEDSDDDDACSINSFHTAVDDLDLEYSECSDVLDESWLSFSLSSIQLKLFMMGDEPCKTDVDVLRVLESVDVDCEKYPLLSEWKQNILSFPEELRNRWSLASGQKPHHSTPKHSTTPDSGSRYGSHGREDSFGSGSFEEIDHSLSPTTTTVDLSSFRNVRSQILFT